MTDKRALAWARPIASAEDDERREIELSVSNPTAITVSKIIRLSVTIRANPRGGEIRRNEFFIWCGVRVDRDLQLFGNVL